MKNIKTLLIFMLIFFSIFISVITLLKKYNTLNSQASISNSPAEQIQQINAKLLSGKSVTNQELLKRKDILTQELKTNPTLFLSHVLPEKNILKLNKPTLTENYLTIKQGNIFTVISEDFKNKPITNNYLQTPEKKQYEIILPQSKKQTFSNEKATFTKKFIFFNKKIITSEKNITLQQEEPPILTDQSVAVVLITFSKEANNRNITETKKNLKEKILNLNNPYSVNSYYKNVTKNNFYFNAETSEISDWISLYSEIDDQINESGGNFCEIFNQIINNERYNEKNYGKIAFDKFSSKIFDRYIYIFNPEFDPNNNKDGRVYCINTHGGLAGYGGNETSIFTDIQSDNFISIIIHEIGHNLNLNHAGAGQFINGRYQIFEYADGFNPMGNGPIANQLRQPNLYGYFGGLHQIGLNMNLVNFEKQIIEVKSSKKSTKINFLNSNLQEKKMIRVIQNDQPSDEKINYLTLKENGFFIECQKYSRYNEFPQFKNQGGIALIRKNYYSFYWGDPPFTILMDVHPQTPNDFSDAYLTTNLNDYYFDQTSNILVKLESVDQSECNFSIKYNAEKPSIDPKLPYFEPTITPTPLPTITLTPTITPTPFYICTSKYPSCPSNWSCNRDPNKIVPGTQGSFTSYYCTKNPN